jgi:hypothetical protein
MHVLISIVCIHKSPEQNKHIFVNTTFYCFLSVSTYFKVVKLTSETERGVYVFARLFDYAAISIVWANVCVYASSAIFLKQSLYAPAASLGTYGQTLRRYHKGC